MSPMKLLQILLKKNWQYLPVKCQAKPVDRGERRVPSLMYF